MAVAGSPHLLVLLHALLVVVALGCSGRLLLPSLCICVHLVHRYPGCGLRRHERSACVLGTHGTPCMRPART